MSRQPMSGKPSCLLSYSDTLNGLEVERSAFDWADGKIVDLIIADDVEGCVRLVSKNDGMYGLIFLDSNRWLRYRDIMSFHLFATDLVTDETPIHEATKILGGDIIAVIAAFDQAYHDDLRLKLVDA